MNLMNLWLGVGIFVNIIIGLMMFGVDSFGLVKNSAGLEKLLVLPDSLWLLRWGMGLWFLSLLASCVGALLIFLRKEKIGAWLLFVGGFFFFPVGLLQVNGAMLLLRQLKEQTFVDKYQLPLNNEALDSNIFRKRESSLFDMGLGFLLSIGALSLVYYTNTQHFYRHLPSTIPKGVLRFVRPDEYSSSYVLLGMVMLLSFYVLTLLAIVLMSKFSFFVVWKVLSAAFLSGPLVPFAFGFGLLLFLWGMGSFQRPFLQLHEHYFTLRSSLFGWGLHALYKDIQNIEFDDKKRLFLHVLVSGQIKQISLPTRHLGRLEWKQLLGQFEKRKERQHKHVY